MLLTPLVISMGSMEFLSLRGTRSVLVDPMVTDLNILNFIPNFKLLRHLFRKYYNLGQGFEAANGDIGSI